MEDLSWQWNRFLSLHFQDSLGSDFLTKWLLVVSAGTRHGSLPHCHLWRCFIGGLCLSKGGRWMERRCGWGWIMRYSKRQVRGQRDKHLWQKWGHEIICPTGEDRVQEVGGAWRTANHIYLSLQTDIYVQEVLRGVGFYLKHMNVWELLKGL